METLRIVRAAFGTVQIAHNQPDWLDHHRKLGQAAWPNLRVAKAAAKAAGYTVIEFDDNPEAQHPRVRIITL